MFCDNCGNEIFDNESLFCENCGNRLNFDQEPISYQNPEQMPENLPYQYTPQPMQSANNQEYVVNNYDQNYIAYANTQNPIVQKSNKKPLIIALVVALILLVISAFFRLFIFDNDDADEALASTTQETTLAAETQESTTEQTTTIVTFPVTTTQEETQETTTEQTTTIVTFPVTTTQEETTTTETQTQETTLSSSQIQENNRALYIEYLDNHLSADLLFSYQFADVNYDGVEEMIAIFNIEDIAATDCEFCTIVNSKVVLVESQYCATTGIVFAFHTQNDTGKIILVKQEYRNSGGIYGQFYRIQSFDGSSITEEKYSGYFQTSEYLEEYDGFYEQNGSFYYYYFLSEDGGITSKDNFTQGDLLLQYTAYTQDLFIV